MSEVVTKAPICEVKEIVSPDMFKGLTEHEELFRDILYDLKVKKRLPSIIPDSVDPDADLDTIKSYFKPTLSGQGFGIGEFCVGPETPEDHGKFLLHHQVLNLYEAAIEVHNCRGRGYPSESRVVTYNFIPGRPPQFVRSETRK